MKKPFNPVLPIDYTPRAKRKEEETLDFEPCLNCGKQITDGYYGRFGSGGVCSKTCNTEQEMKAKHPPPSESFLQQLSEQKNDRSNTKK